MCRYCLPLLRFALVTVAFLIPCARSDAQRALHRAVAVARSKQITCGRLEDAQERATCRERLCRFIDRRIQEHRDKPEVLVRLREAQFKVYLDMGDSEQAVHTIRSQLEDYRDSAGERRFRAWLANYLRRITTSSADPAWLKHYQMAARELNIQLPEYKHLDLADDLDGDGVHWRDERCGGFDDAVDSDGDGVPDGCDHCWGFPDDADKDKDYVPDGCDVCPRGDDFDFDMDEVPGGCDNCPDAYNPLEPRPEGDPLHDPACRCDSYPADDCCWQPDEDDDGSGDPCDVPDPPESKGIGPTKVVDQAGNVLESFEYNEHGDLTRWIKWGGDHEPIMITDYYYDENQRCTHYIKTPQDGSAPPKTSRMYYGEHGHVIGIITDGDDEQAVLKHRDKKGRVIKVTTVADSSDEAIVLERYKYDREGHLLLHEGRLSPDGPLEVIETSTYERSESGDLTVTTRSRVGPDSESLVILRYEGGVITSRTEYADPISPRGAAPSVQPLVTRFLYERNKQENGYVLSEKRTTIHPSGTREVSAWRIEGTPYKSGSQQITERYTTDLEDPGESEKRELTREVKTFFEKDGGYVLTLRVDPWSTTKYTPDPNAPRYVLAEEVSTRQGESVLTVKRFFKYHDTGRLAEERTVSGDEDYTVAYEYDHQGRVVLEKHIDAHREIHRHRRYDAYDKLLWSYQVVHAPSFSIALPEWWAHVECPSKGCVMNATGWGLGPSDAALGDDAVRGSVALERLHARPDTTSSPSASTTARARIKRSLDRHGQPANLAPCKEEQVRLATDQPAVLVWASFDGGSSGQNIVMVLVAENAADTWVVECILRQTSKSPEAVVTSHADLMRGYLGTLAFDRNRFDSAAVEARLGAIGRPEAEP